MLHFVWWFADADNIGYAPLYWLLTFSLSFKLLRTLYEWYHYVSVREPVAIARQPGYQPTVDVLTTACPGEPREMIVRTLHAMQAIRYPHTSYLCDEGNDPYLRLVCEQLGVRHVTRQHKVNAKAGNINHALEGAAGELCVVLNPDHVPVPEFLDEVVAYFQDPKVGFVQVVQAYGNQQDSLVAQGAAEQTYHFYGPLLMGMNGYGTVQAIGANCTFRRAALDSIGGHAAGLTEDMHTAMRLHAQGWQSVYVPKVVSRGLVPSTLAAFYSQQLKWARGAFDLLFRVYPLLFTQFTWRQRVHYLLLPLYFFSGVITLIDIAVPALALVSITFPWRVNLADFVLHLLPLTAISLLIRVCAQRWLRESHETGLHLAGGILRVGSWWVYSLGWLYAILRVRVPYIPTPKEGRVSNEWLLSLPNLVLAIALIALAKYGRTLSYTPATQLMSGLVLLNAAILLLAVAMAQQALLHQLIRGLTATRPLRALVLALERGWQSMGHRTAHWARHDSRLAAGCIVGAYLLSSVMIQGYYDHYAAVVRQEWPLTGADGLHLGQQVASHELNPVHPVAYRAATDTSAIIGFDLPPSSTPYLLESMRRAMTENRNVTLLTWPVKAEQIGPLRQLSLQRLARLQRPIMLRPLLTASSPAVYRQHWQQLVRRFRAAGVRNVVWVWTPPRPDSLSAYFPGVTYVDWVAVNGLRATDATPAKWYPQVRAQLAPQIELHAKPVLLLVAASKETTAAPEQLVRDFPEVKAVVFGRSDLNRPTLSLTSIRLPDFSGSQQRKKDPGALPESQLNSGSF
jgi:cellulose synthase (UDP-forming)